jgi:hypothetical protein
VKIERRGYRLEVREDGRRATLLSPAGDHWLTLGLLAAFDVVETVDETLTVAEPVLDGDTVIIERSSTLWRGAGVRLTCSDDALELDAWVEGEGSLTDLHLLGGRSLVPGTANGFYPTGSSFRTLFSPNPGDPAKLVRAASEPAVIGVTGDGAPGRGHWFFTPAPLLFALTTAAALRPDEQVEEGWLGLGLAAPVEQLGFVQAVYRPSDRAFHLVLEYEGHTRVHGRCDAPTLLLRPGARTAYEAIASHRADAAAPIAQTRSRPTWWSEPMFCGWGAQCALSARGTGAAGLSTQGGGLAPSLATQENYDAFLAALAAHDLVPGTVVIDDKWQQTYGRNEPDTAKWPDLRGWIAERHAHGQRVLLWWKAWDAEGIADELCVQTPDGTRGALDPTNPATRELLREVMTQLVGADGLGADGLKIDFTARTPSGQAYRAYGPGWGIALLHDLLSVVYAAVKQAKPDALVITHTPHPAFADVTDMVRLNDMLRLDDPGPVPAGAVVEQMRYRAQVATAALPDTLIDTDDWCVPDLATWRDFLEAKPELGVPSLYYATHLDLSGEALEEVDYAALRRVWGEWRERAQ